MTETLKATVKIVLADDHLFFRNGFKNIIKSQEYKNEIVFAGEAANGLQLVDLVDRLNPRIVFTDIKMPEMDGIEAARIITKKFPATRVIALSALEDAHSVNNILQAGAMGYITKNCTWDEIYAAIISVYNGQSYYSNTIAGKVYGRFIAGRVLRSRTNPVKLSPQEVSVVKLICKELTSKEIATTLKLHTRTVEDYRYSVLEKIGAKNLAGIVVYALTNEIIKLSEL